MTSPGLKLIKGEFLTLSFSTTLRDSPFYLGVGHHPFLRSVEKKTRPAVGLRMKLDPQRLRSAHSTRMLYSVSHPRAAVWRSDSEIAEVRRVLRKNSGRMLRILRCFFLLKLFPTRLPNMNGLSYLSYLQKSLQSCILTHFRSSVIQLYLSHVYSCF